VVGVDPSTTMLAQARKRNSESVELGKVKLVQARAEELPDDFGGPFDRVYSRYPSGERHLGARGNLGH
jgi:ubiquinone/menaquinone biosynthesis C-methylase UbiE